MHATVNQIRDRERERIIGQLFCMELVNEANNVIIKFINKQL